MTASFTASALLDRSWRVVNLGSVLYGIVTLTQSGFSEPAEALIYDVEPYELVDDIETDFDEKENIDPGMENPYAIAVHADPQ